MTSDENTVCYATQESCPIVDIKFVTETEVDSFKSDADFTVLPFKGSTQLVYTKKKVDSLPITRTKIENKPCLDPNYSSDTALLPG